MIRLVVAAVLMAYFLSACDFPKCGVMWPCN